MKHIAVTGVDEQGRNVEWLEKASDQQYEGETSVTTS